MDAGGRSVTWGLGGDFNAGGFADSQAFAINNLCCSSARVLTLSGFLLNYKVEDFVVSSVTILGSIKVHVF